MTRRIATAALAAVILGLSFAGCGRGADPGPAADGGRPLRKILFVGVDGADWQVLEPLLAAGRLPHFQRLIDGGSRGDLRSLEPMLSPLLWTTMATGKLPEEHGILSFTTVDPRTGTKVPIGRNARRVDAFWNMLSDAGRSVDIVGWLATYPAETIRGVMVSDRLGYLAYAGAGDAASPGTIAPPERAAEIAARVVGAPAVTYEEFARVLHIDRTAFEQARGNAFDVQSPINNMIMLYASTRSYAAIAAHLLATDRPDFLGVYFELVDATGHLFMHYAPPMPPGTDPERFAQFKDATDMAYVVQDEILGDLLAKIGDDTVVMIASDHGFRSGAARPTTSPEIAAGKAAFWHRMEGVIVLAGNGVKRGHRISGATLLDIAPTILALQGLPKPADMPGRVLVEALDDTLVARIDTRHVATLQRPREAVVAPAGDDAAARDAIKKLEALGYLAQETPDSHHNLGLRLQQQGEHAKAIVEFEQALAMRPNFPSALNSLGRSYLELEQYAKAEEIFRRVLAVKPDDIYALNNIAITHMDRGNLDTARKFAERAVAVEPNYANGHLTLGSIYGTMKRYADAEREFNRVLAIDPANARAASNLAKLRDAGLIDS